MPTRLTGGPSLAYVGVEAPQPPNITQHKTDPTTTDYFNFNTGDLWLNSQPDVPSKGLPANSIYRIWMLVAKVNHVATWIMISGGNGSVLSLTPAKNQVPTGAAVLPIGGTIQINNPIPDNNIDVSTGPTNNLNIQFHPFINVVGLAHNNTVTSNVLFDTDVAFEGINSSNSAFGGTFNGVKIRGAAAAQNGDLTATFAGTGYDGTGFQETAHIDFRISGAVGAGVLPQRMEFMTSNTNAVSIAIRMIISSTGNVIINAPDSGAALTSISTFGFVCNGTGIPVLVDNAGQFGTVASSIKVKDNVKNMGDYSSKIFDLRPVTFNFKKHSPDNKSVGLIAEEVADVFPELAVYDKGEPQTVKYLDLIPMLLNEIQKLNRRIELLESITSGSL